MQSAHAAWEAAKKLPDTSEHPHFVIFGLVDERALWAALDRTRKSGFRPCVWHEPDMDDSLTAFAVGPVYGSDRKHFRRYPLLKGGE